MRSLARTSLPFTTIVSFGVGALSRRLLAMGFCLAIVAGLACATSGKPISDPKAPPPPSVITSDEDFGDARSTFSALLPGSRERVTFRKPLLDYLLPRIRARLDAGDDDAVDLFRTACSLYNARDLDHFAKGDAPPEMSDLALRIAQRYSPQGAEEPVLLGLAVAATVEKKYEATFDERLKWIDSFEVAAGGSIRKWTRSIEALESAVRIWPSQLVTDRLERLYIERHNALVAAIRKGDKGEASDLVAAQEVGATHSAYNLAALHLRRGDFERARKVLQTVVDQPGDDPVLRQLLAKADGSKTAGPVLELAKHFARLRTTDREVSLDICRAGIERFPQDADLKVCVAETAVSTSPFRIPLGIRMLSEAIAIDPERRSPSELLARLRLTRMAARFGEDRTFVDAAIPEAERLVVFLGECNKRFPSPRFVPTPADVWLDVGRGYYSSGVPDLSEKYLERSLEIEATWMAYDQLGMLRLKQQKWPEAVALFEKALALPTDSLRDRIEVRSRVERNRGEVLARMGRKKESRAARVQALEAWTQLLALIQDPGRTSEAEFERGRLLYELGKPREALEAFEKAIDTAPARPETYAEVIAFLVPRGHLYESLDAYHRVLGRSDISDYIKVYTSLWVTDLARRSKEPIDPLAEQFLTAANGTKWHDELARWASHRITWDQLLARANTNGRKAEAYFYKSLEVLAKGQEKDAKDLWKKVIDTRMMAFFEFDMADFYLRKGAPTKAPALPAPERQQPEEPPMSEDAI